MQLQITITTETLQDFDDANYDVRHANVHFDGVFMGFDATFETTVSDADIKTAVRAMLTDKGYVWDSEI